MYCKHMYILQDCTAESERELCCVFPEIPDDEVDDIINGTLELRYSLVAASVPDLANLHLMPQFSIEFVEDPVVFNLNDTMVYERGSNTPITIHVSVYVRVFVRALMCMYVQV